MECRGDCSPDLGYSRLLLRLVCRSASPADRVIEKPGDSFSKPSNQVSNRTQGVVLDIEFTRDAPVQGFDPRPVLSGHTVMQSETKSGKPWIYKFVHSLLYDESETRWVVDRAGLRWCWRQDR